MMDEEVEHLARKKYRVRGYMYLRKLVRKMKCAKTSLYSGNFGLKFLTKIWLGTPPARVFRDGGRYAATGPRTLANSSANAIA